MGLVNDALPNGAIGESRHQPDRESRLALGYERRLNVTAELLDRHLAAGFGWRPAVRGDGRVVTYRALHERVSRLANVMRHLRVDVGSRVLIYLPNCEEFVESWLASLRIGAVVVAAIPMLKERELSQIVEETEPVCVVTTPLLDAALGAVLPEYVKRILVGPRVPTSVAYEELVSQARPTAAPAETSEDDVALIAYTSGSTGRQKGTVHTHSDVLAIADAYAAQILSPSPEDRFACHAPMGFTYGLGALLIFPLRFGASTILDCATFDPARWLGLIKQEQATYLFATPSAARFYLEEPACVDRGTWKSVRTVVSAGEALSRATFERWQECTGIEILDGCGSTEMLHIWMSQRRGEAAGGCTGRPVPHYEVQLLDESGEVIGSKEAEGVAALRGPTGCRYWRQPELQSKVVRNGWTSSGDVFRRDHYGRYWFVSRTDDIIVTGGYKVSPSEVEEVLRLHPAVLDVVVVGVQDQQRGQIVRGCVVLRPGIEPRDGLAREIQGFASMSIAAFKCPRQVILLREFPKTPTGKVDRRTLREPS